MKAIRILRTVLPIILLAGIPCLLIGIFSSAFFGFAFFITIFLFASFKQIDKQFKMVMKMDALTESYTGVEGRRVSARSVLSVDDLKLRFRSTDSSGSQLASDFFSIRKWRGCYFLSSSEELNDVVHPHNRAKLFGVPFLWNIRWYEVEPSCSSIDMVNSPILSLSDTKTLRGSKKSDLFSAEEFFMGKYAVPAGEYGYTLSHNSQTILPEHVRKNKPAELNYVDLHDLLHHPDDCVLSNPELTGMPVSYVNSLFNLPHSLLRDK